MVQQMKEKEAAHKQNMEQFQAKIKAEQAAQVQDLKRQMDNDRAEVKFKRNF